MTSRIRRTRGDRAFDLAVNAFLLLVLLVTLVPLVYVVLVSVTPLGRAPGLTLPPWEWSATAYAELLKQPAMLRAGLNSVIVTVGGVLISISHCRAYATATAIAVRAPAPPAPPPADNDIPF